MTIKSDSEINDNFNRKKELEQIIELTKLGIRLKYQKEFNKVIDWGK